MTEQADSERISDYTNDTVPIRSIIPIVAVFFVSIFLALSFGLSVNAIVKTTKYQTTYNAEQVGKYVTLIGDSISYMSQEELRDALPGVDLEVKGGMQFARYSEWAGESGMVRIKKHALREVVVFLLGSNEGVTTEELKAFYDYVGEGHKIVLMTIYRGHRPDDMARWNDNIKSFVAEHENIYLMDWYSENADNPSRYLLQDMLHPVKSGELRFAELVRQSVLQALDISE